MLWVVLAAVLVAVGLLCLAVGWAGGRQEGYQLGIAAGFRESSKQLPHIIQALRAPRPGPRMFPEDETPPVTSDEYETRLELSRVGKAPR